MAIRNLTIGTAVVLVLGAIAAGNASAAYLQATEYPGEVKAQREGEAHVFGIEGLSVKCLGASFGAELVEPLETLEVTPQYSECTSLGVAATVTTEGCKYRLDANASDVDLVCPAGKSMRIVALSGSCEVQIGSQNGIEKDEYVNHAEAPKTVTVKLKTEKIKYTKVKDSGICPLSGTGEKSDGTYTGSFLAKAFHGAQVGFFQGPAALTKLCAEEIHECPEGQTYPAGTGVRFEATAGELLLIWAVGGNGVLECTKWTLSALSGAAQGAPFLALSPGFIFTPCSITAGNGLGSKCTVSMSASGAIQAVGNSRDGRWKLGLTDLVISNCSGIPVMVRCEFQAVSPAMTLRGGLAKVGMVEANTTFQLKKGNPGDNCPGSADWKVTYVNNPEAGAGNLFVTN